MNDLARGIERAGLLAGGGARFGVIGCQQVLENFTQQFGVEGDLLFDGRVLFNRELVMILDRDQAAHCVFLVLRAVNFVQVNLAFFLQQE